MKPKHFHTWAKVELFRPPVNAYTCTCGAALTLIEGQAHYSPRRRIGGGWTWHRVTFREGAARPSQA